MKVKISLDPAKYQEKPKSNEIGKISNRIAGNPQNIKLGEAAAMIGNQGCSFCPAIFSEGKRRTENFKEIQLLALDFDKGLSFDEIRSRAERYNLRIAFAYATFTSTEPNPKFRIVFLNDCPVSNRKIAEIMMRLLMEIFGEADKSCKDVTRMFFGGKGLIGAVKETSINIVDLTLAFQQYVFETDRKNYAQMKMVKLRIFLLLTHIYIRQMQEIPQKDPSIKSRSVTSIICAGRLRVLNQFGLIGMKLKNSVSYTTILFMGFLSTII